MSYIVSNTLFKHGILSIAMCLFEETDNDLSLQWSELHHLQWGGGNYIHNVGIYISLGASLLHTDGVYAPAVIENSLYIILSRYNYNVNILVS